jgi:hypothetical protein
MSLGIIQMEAKMRHRSFLLCMLLPVALTGCAKTIAQTSVPLASTVGLEMIPLESPVPIQTIEIYDPAAGTRVETDVRALSAGDLRRELSATTTFITVEKQNAKGSFDFMGSGGSIEHGVYRMTFDYVNYTTYEIKTSDNNVFGVGQIGVGLRIIAHISNTSGRINVGGLLPVGLAAEAGNINGSLSLRVLGMSNDKLALSVPGSLTLDASGIQKAFESAAAVRVLFVDDDTQITPWLLGVSGSAAVKNPDKVQSISSPK